jgi:1,4-alpha-glucan branching enzyme
MAVRKPRYGHVAIVLHAHMPYVLGHGRWPHGVDWLNEAVAETYLPLINMLSDLLAEGTPACLTMGTSPVLLEQLSDPRFKPEFDQYLSVKEQAAKENEAEFASQKTADGAVHAALASAWHAQYRQWRTDFFDRYGGDLVGALRRLQDAGAVEVMTCAATHGYLPLLKEEGSIRAQIRLAVKVYERHYGRRPRGIWLPECAYRPRGPWIDPLHPAEGGQGERPGLEEVLADEGLEYFVVDRHLLQNGEVRSMYLDRYAALRQLGERGGAAASGAGGRPGEAPRPTRPATLPADSEPGLHAAYLTSSHPFFEKTVAFFTRDAEAALQVWSGEFGYPGDPYYLDFHKKHWPGGLRYWRVTDFRADLGAKQVYEPARVDGRLNEHAAHYIGVLRDILMREREDERREDGGVVCIPFDAELFGHWWFEGPRFLAQVLRGLAPSLDLKPTTLGQELDRHMPTKVVRLAEGSWGKGGHHWIWFNDGTRWTWEDVHEAEARMAALVAAYGRRPEPLLKTLIAQTGRELLLLEASDWQFILSAMEAGDYAAERVKRHYADFSRLAQLVDKVAHGATLAEADAEFLRACQARDPLFAEVDADLWQ